jgi:hypothetical protein
VPGDVQARGVVLVAGDPLAVPRGVKVRAAEAAHAELGVGAVGRPQRLDRLAVGADPVKPAGRDVEPPLRIEGDAISVLAASGGEGRAAGLLAGGQRQLRHQRLAVGQHVEVAVGTEGETVGILDRRGGDLGLGPAGGHTVDVAALLVGVVDGPVLAQGHAVDVRLHVGQLPDLGLAGQEDGQQLLAVARARVQHRALRVQGEAERLAAQIQPARLGPGVRGPVAAQEAGGALAEGLGEVDGPVGRDHQSLGGLDPFQVGAGVATGARRGFGGRRLGDGRGRQEHQGETDET